MGLEAFPQKRWRKKRERIFHRSISREICGNPQDCELEPVGLCRALLKSVRFCQGVLVCLPAHLPACLPVCQSVCSVQARPTVSQLKILPFEEGWRFGRFRKIRERNKTTVVLSVVPFFVATTFWLHTQRIPPHHSRVRAWTHKEGRKKKKKKKRKNDPSSDGRSMTCVTTSA